MDSKNWYFEVNSYLRLLVECYDITLLQACGIMSALSPNNKFEQNINSLEKFLIHKGNCKVSTFNGQKEKAKQILFMVNPTEQGIKDILRGDKTMAFFENLYRPETSDAVTIDLWQLRWALKVGVWKKDWGTLTTKRYKLVADAIRIKAEKHNMLPHQFQALTWTQIRGNQY